MNIAGRILVLASAGICLLSMFLPYFDYGDDDAFTLWESLSRSDILMAVLCVASIAVAVVSLAQARARVAHALTIAAGGVLFGIFGFYLIEYSPDRGYAAGALIGGIAGLLGLVGAVLLSAGVGKLGRRPRSGLNRRSRWLPPRRPRAGTPTPPVPAANATGTAAPGRDHVSAPGST